MKRLGFRGRRNAAGISGVASCSGGGGASRGCRGAVGRGSGGGIAPPFGRHILNFPLGTAATACGGAASTPILSLAARTAAVPPRRYGLTSHGEVVKDDGDADPPLGRGSDGDDRFAAEAGTLTVAFSMAAGPRCVGEVAEGRPLPAKGCGTGSPPEGALFLFP